MSTSRIFGIVLAGLVVAGHSQAIYEDTKIRSWWYIMADGWSMTDTSAFAYSANSKFIPYPYHPVSDTFNIIGMNTYIVTDNQDEVFNLTRQSGHNAGPGGQRAKSGGTSQVHQYCDVGDCEKSLYFFWDRGQCLRGLGNQCATPPSGYKDRDNFFFGNKDPTVTRSTAFHNGGGDRGISKLDYICPGTCPTPTYNVLWHKLGAWDMTGSLPSVKPGKAVELYSTHGILPEELLDLQAVIHSDPGAGELAGMEVDNFEHLGNRGSDNRGRGGILWYGRGCGHSTNCGLNGSNREVKMWPGYIEYGEGEGNRGHYIGQYSGVRTYESTSQNRGWLKVEYLGTKSSARMPYAMKTRAIEIGPWDMSTTLEKSLNLASLRISPDRVSGLMSTIRTDWEACGLNCWPGWSFTNFHRTALVSGTKTSSVDGGGGFTMIEPDGVGGYKIRLRQTDHANYYDNSSFNDPYVNRGFVKVDYLAGSCEQGLDGWDILAIPSVYAHRGSCSNTVDEGEATAFSIEGWGFVDGSTTQDSITYAYRSNDQAVTNTSVRVDGFTTDGTGWAGIMERGYDMHSPQEAHASVLVSSTGNLKFVYRAVDGSSSVTAGTASGVSFPVWLTLKRDLTTYTAWYHTSSASTQPSFDMDDPAEGGWVQIGTAGEVTSFGESNLVGLVVGNTGSYKLAKANFFNFEKKYYP